MCCEDKIRQITSMCLWRSKLNYGLTLECLVEWAEVWWNPPSQPTSTCFQSLFPGSKSFVAFMRHYYQARYANLQWTLQTFLCTFSSVRPLQSILYPMFKLLRISTVLLLTWILYTVTANTETSWTFAFAKWNYFNLK